MLGIAEKKTTKNGEISKNKVINYGKEENHS